MFGFSPLRMEQKLDERLYLKRRMTRSEMVFYKKRQMVDSAFACKQVKSSKKTPEENAAEKEKNTELRKAWCERQSWFLFSNKKSPGPPPLSLFYSLRFVL